MPENGILHVFVQWVERRRKKKKLVKGVTSKMKLCKSLKMSQIQNNGLRLVTFQTRTFVFLQSSKD